MSPRLPPADALAAALEQLARDLRTGALVVRARADLDEALRALTEPAGSRRVAARALARLIDATTTAAARGDHG